MWGLTNGPPRSNTHTHTHTPMREHVDFRHQRDLAPQSNPGPPERILRSSAGRPNWKHRRHFALPQMHVRPVLAHSGSQVMNLIPGAPVVLLLLHKRSDGCIRRPQRIWISRSLHWIHQHAEDMVPTTVQMAPTSQSNEGTMAATTGTPAVPWGTTSHSCICELERRVFAATSAWIYHGTGGA